MSERELLTIDEAAEKYHVGKATLYVWCNEGKLKFEGSRPRSKHPNTPMKLYPAAVIEELIKLIDPVRRQIGLHGRASESLNKAFPDGDYVFGYSKAAEFCGMERTTLRGMVAKNQLTMTRNFDTGVPMFLKQELIALRHDIFTKARELQRITANHRPSNQDPTNGVDDMTVTVNFASQPTRVLEPLPGAPGGPAVAPPASAGREGSPEDKPPSAASEDVEINPTVRRNIFYSLEDKYDIHNGCYRQDWNDAKVAAALGLKPGVIALVRSQFFGGARNPILEQALHRLDELQLDAKAAYESLALEVNRNNVLKHELAELRKLIEGARHD